MHYIKGGIDRASRSELIKPLKLSAEEKGDLLAFMKTFNSDSSTTTFRCFQIGIDIRGEIRNEVTKMWPSCAFLGCNSVALCDRANHRPEGQSVFAERGLDQEG